MRPQKPLQSEVRFCVSAKIIIIMAYFVLVLSYMMHRPSQESRRQSMICSSLAQLAVQRPLTSAGSNQKAVSKMMWFNAIDNGEHLEKQDFPVKAFYQVKCYTEDF